MIPAGIATRRVFVLAALLFFSMVAISFPLRYTPPKTIYLNCVAQLSKPDTIRLAIDFSSAIKFSIGRLTMKILRKGEISAETVKLWNGTSESRSYLQTVGHSIQLLEGQRVNVLIRFEMTGVDGIPYSSVLEASYLHLADTLVHAWGGYEWLDVEEINYLQKKKGYENLTEEQIREIDYRFWKRIQRVKHGLGKKKL